MILKFPDLATLQLALTSSVIPVSVSQTPAVALFEGDAVWVQTSASLPRSAQNELKRMGVQSYRSLAGGSVTEISCWLQMLPLRPEPDVLAGLEQTPVLFDLPDGAQMARLAGEMLRLGNDRQGFRWLEGPSAGRALLRVVGPPYYSLLRALDRRDNPDAPVAYVERAPSVWVEAGFNHPLAERIKPPAGQLLLLRPLRRWTLLADGPFRDVYEVLEFQVPEGPSAWEEGGLDTKLGVRLSLRPGGSPDNPELWVLGGDAVAELDHFVQNNDDQLLGRLAFAVGEQAGRKTIVVRVRQSRQPPPQLVLNAVGYRHHLKLPNLFLPVGMGLHPPLRRDKVRELFAEDVDRITWLAPAPEGTFTPQSLPGNAFRPLTDWVEYVLDHDREALDAWVGAASFDFEDFICNEDGTPKQPKKAEPPQRGRSSRKSRDATTSALDLGTDARLGPAAEDPAVAAELDAFASAEPAPPSELEQELRGLEQTFLDLEGTLDVAERRGLWLRMARCNAGLAKYDDAGLCWLHGIWGEKAVPAAAAAQWFAVESAAALRSGELASKRSRSWLARKAGKPTPCSELSGKDLDWLLGQKEPSLADLRALAAYLTWAGSTPRPPAALLERLQPLHLFLQAHEGILPVRAMWLAWFHLAQLSGGDALALARARDRLLERLFQSGLRPEQDLPSFLRLGSQPSTQRFRAVREWMISLADVVHDWVDENAESAQHAPTEAYADLLFAFGLARLGEAEAARKLLERAAPRLQAAEEHLKEAVRRAEAARATEQAIQQLREGLGAHPRLGEAFQYRVTRALEGQPHTGPLPAALLDALQGIPAMARYIVDRLRGHSWVLEPDQRIDPYRKWAARMSELDTQLAELTDLSDRKEIAARVTKLLKGLPRGDDGAEPRARVLRAGLEAAPRVGEDFGRAMLEQALPAFDALPAPADAEALSQQAHFLEKALFVAAHFDRVEHIHPLVTRFGHLLRTQRGPQAVQKMETLAGQCFRGLRKLGMRDEIDRLLTQMAEVVLQGRDVTAVSAEVLPALLRVAAEWYFFGRDSQAEPVLQAARSLLLRGDLVKQDATKRQQVSLACAYARTVGQAPVSIAQKRLEEIFTAVEGINDGFTTRSHYSRAQLDLVEAVVLAVVSDDFTLGTQARRWLDEDEFLIRRRVHADVKSLKGEG